MPLGGTNRPCEFFDSIERLFRPPSTRSWDQLFCRRVAPPEAFHERRKDRLPLLRSEANGRRDRQSPAVLVTVFASTSRGRRPVVSLDVFTVMPGTESARIAG
jgi:hypothetical protein